MIACANCGREFEPHRAGHLYCSRQCRHAARDPDRMPADPKEIERLFDESRDPEEQVHEDDWHPSIGYENGEKARALDAYQTVGDRRRWYRNLRAEGEV